MSSVLKKYPGKSPIPVNKELNNEKIIYIKKENKVKCTRLSQKHEKKWRKNCSKGHISVITVN